MPSSPDPLREALAELVALKDGPRDAEYERRKPLAWQAAREALAAVPEGPEPRYEWRAMGRDEGDLAPEVLDDGPISRARAFVVVSQERAARNPYNEVWMERRVVGEWERVEEGTER